MFRRVIFAAALTLCGAPALADCPLETIQQTATLFTEITPANPSIPGVLKQIDAQVAACPNDPHVLKMAGMAYGNAVSRVPAQLAVDRLTHARELFHVMWDNLKGASQPVTVQVGGKAVRLHHDDLYDIESQVLDSLFAAEKLAKTLSPENRVDAPMRACRSGDNTDAQRAWMSIKNKGDHAGAFNLLDNVVRYCAAELDQGLRADILSYRARALIVSAKRDLGKPDVLARLKQAKVDGDRYFRIKGAYSFSNWSKTEAAELNKLLVNAYIGSGEAPSRDQWFVAPNVGDPIVVRLIAMTLDTAWAEDQKNGGIAVAYKSYRAEMSDLYAKATTSADPAAAKRALASGARDHADKTVRAPENLEHPAPPNFLWTWIDPEIQPAE